MARDSIVDQLIRDQPWYVCLRRHTLYGIPRVRGEVVEMSDIRSDRLDSLVSRRYLYQLPHGMSPPPAVMLGGEERRFIEGYLPEDATDPREEMFSRG